MKADTRLTKTKIKDELRRRMAWFEEAYEFTDETSREDMIECSYYKTVAFGRYCAIKEMLYQIETGLFVDGFSC
jgi:hypothetical protein